MGERGLVRRHEHCGRESVGYSGQHDVLQGRVEPARRVVHGPILELSARGACVGCVERRALCDSYKLLYALLIYEISLFRANAEISS